jgi:hypothetical protein
LVSLLLFLIFLYISTPYLLSSSSCPVSVSFLPVCMRLGAAVRPRASAVATARVRAGAAGPARGVLVRKVVPTLTSRSAEIYLSMAGAKQLVTLGLSWFRPGAVRPAGVCSRHYIALHRGACSGGLQAKREKRSGLQVLEVLIDASANIVVRAESVQVSVVRGPPRLGDCHSFYKPRRWQFTSVLHYFIYV